MAEQRTLIDRLRSEYRRIVICKALGFHRSWYYYAATPSDDAKLQRAIEAVVAEFPTYGYRRVTESAAADGANAGASTLSA